MLHPSYTDLMKVVNSEVEPGEEPVVQSRYSIVIATAKRARQIIDGEEPLVEGTGRKPLSIAIDELYQGKVKIMTEEEFDAEEERIMEHNHDVLDVALEDADEEIFGDELEEEDTVQ